MQPIEPPDSHRLRAAEGWLELGNFAEAERELNDLPTGLRNHPDALRIGWKAAAQQLRWEMCVNIAESILSVQPGQPDAWILRSFALHELRRTKEAFDLLLPAAREFPRIWTIRYNLACYCSQLGRLEECRLWFDAALALDEETVRRTAADDPDLEPFWKGRHGPA